MMKMSLTHRELWTALHGMVFGAGFLLLFSGGFVALWSLANDSATRIVRRAAIGLWTMAIFAWIAVLLGTYLVYPWYRAKPPANASADVLVEYPKFLLLSKPQTADWHQFGMEWKEHIAWLVPIMITAVAFVVTRHGRQLIGDVKLRRAVLILFSISFFCAGVAGVFGALINKAAPTR